MSRFERDARGDPLAGELTGVLRDQIEQQLATAGGPQQLVHFACGLSLCVGAVRTGVGAQWNSEWWLPVGEFRRVFTYQEATVSLGGGDMEHRFLFSTDDKLRAFTVRR
jgi:hypothetical protein